MVLVPHARAMNGSLLSCSKVISWRQVVGANLDQIGMKPLYNPPNPSVLMMWIKQPKRLLNYFSSPSF